MKRFLMFAALAAVVAAVGASSVGAAPHHGALPVSGTWPGSGSSMDLTLGTFVNGVYSDGLTSFGCPFVLHDYGYQGAGGTLSASYNGWIGPYNEKKNSSQYRLSADLTGAIQDVAGNSYTVSGNFTDNSTRSGTVWGDDLLFDGVGQISLSGSAGTVVGRAEFRFVIGPDEMTLFFTSVKSCTISP